MPFRTALVPSLAVTGAMALTACGSDSKTSSATTAQKPASADVTLREVTATRDGVRRALAIYEQGRRAAAGDQLSETYLRHFEEVEGPLERKDHALKEDLEHALREDLRRQMQRGAPAAAVKRAVANVVADLDKAEALLR
jgi:hypothetical protein